MIADRRKSWISIWLSLAFLQALGQDLRTLFIGSPSEWTKTLEMSLLCSRSKPDTNPFCSSSNERNSFVIGNRLPCPFFVSPGSRISHAFSKSTFFHSRLNASLLRQKNEKPSQQITLQVFKRYSWPKMAGFRVFAAENGEQAVGLQRYISAVQ